MDFLLLPVRAGGRVVFLLVLIRCFVCHNLFAIFALFVFRVCVVFATATFAVLTPTPAVATASSAVAMAFASAPGTEGG